jgi:hypothetical protein
MSDVFQNIDPSPPGECVPRTPRFWCGGGHNRWLETGEGGGGSIFWKTQGTALYSTTYVSTLCPELFIIHDHRILSLDPKKNVSPRGS